ncbi:hypothetical protein HNR65_003381 [Desulfosalsimonas propionicica]|uniref:Beta-barrel porin 2 n=1 Tax=Desulfosalsimonas propionicica TaxID=332175 RepID=A0A7W0HM44_9BACT|nr:outer membrane beta-barrel protein [Desulfosalsimonas propionicica]MBA2883024.1 hypothetical protein [Desulfosalsimonas propionicica]
MISLGKQGRTLPLVFVFLLLYASAALAESTLRGGISLEHGYDSNINREPDNEVDESTTTLSPSLDYTLKSRRSNFSLGYSPGFVYSYLTDDVRTDHYASARYDVQASKSLTLNFSDNFVRTQDPYETDETTESEIEISDRRGRRTYWSNSFSAAAAYTYGRERVLKIGYRNRVLENSDDQYSDYVRHSPYASVNHRINHQWEAGLNYNFSRGDFDEPDESALSEDLTTNSGDFYLYYRLTRKTRIFGHLGYTHSDYDEEPNDYEVYTASMGIDTQYSPSLNLSVNAGASRVEREFFSDEDALYLRGEMEKSWRRTSWYFSAESGLDAREYTGVDNLGLSRYWTAATGMDRTLLRDLTINVDIRYRDDTYLEREPSADEQRFVASAGLSWAFSRWYRLYGKYSFVDNNSDIERDNYVDHRGSIGISAEKDLFRWQ